MKLVAHQLHPSFSEQRKTTRGTILTTKRYPNMHAPRDKD